MVEVESVARRVEEDRLVADAAVERLGHELHALRLERLAGGGDVLHLQGDGQRVRRELLAEGFPGSMMVSVRLPAWYRSPACRRSS